jgi:hypothetical protein
MRISFILSLSSDAIFIKRKKEIKNQNFYFVLNSGFLGNFRGYCVRRHRLANEKKKKTGTDGRGRASAPRFFRSFSVVDGEKNFTITSACAIPESDTHTLVEWFFAIFSQETPQVRPSTHCPPVSFARVTQTITSSFSFIPFLE